MTKALKTLVKKLEHCAFYEGQQREFCVSAPIWKTLRPGDKFDVGKEYTVTYVKGSWDTPHTTPVYWITLEFSLHLENPNRCP